MKNTYTKISFRKLGLLIILVISVFLLIISRGNYVKKNERKKETVTEEWIPLGWVLEELPVFQKKTEQPGKLDGFYGLIFPSLSFPLCFDDQKGTASALYEAVMLENENQKAKLSMMQEEKEETENSSENRWDTSETASAEEMEDIQFGRTEVEPVFGGVDMLSNRQKVVTLNPEDYGTLDAMLKKFYVVDPTTTVTESQVDIDTLLAKDMAITTDSGGPQILIYHTHSQETFSDSVPGDPATSIVGAGEHLAKLLEGYGFMVIHETGEYDIESRSTAYSNIQPVLEQYLAEYPSLQVMIDLHRDEVKEGKLVTEVDGKQMARFMFFNGLSYLNSVGDITYLGNPNKEDNLAFAFQLQYLSEQYFPGLARRIYLKGYRYNLHYLPKSLLIELGAQTNTCDEIFNACEPLAEIIARVLLGEK